MAKSPAHRFGQIIGDLLEETLYEYCKPIANNHSLYLDYKHSRIARDGNKEVKWQDINGNIHKLDIVMEEDGCEEKFGRPKAFIEVAWRRYTKHAKAKAQEISAAIKPLVAKYYDSSPFLGAVLAGEFTETSLDQMRSEGFELLYFPTSMIEEVYKKQGINAHWDESTSEAELQARVDLMEAMSADDRSNLKKALMEANDTQWKVFTEKINLALERNIENIKVIALYGGLREFSSINEACEYISKNSDECTCEKIYKYEITVFFSNGDKIEMQFKEKNNAIVFLRQLDI